MTPDQRKMPAALVALYNASHPQGLGFLQAQPGGLTEVEATEVLEGSSYVDYLKGRVIKVHFTEDRFDLRLYDRDNGQGAGLRALQEAGVVKVPSAQGEC